jgi:protein-S-isoprenylcysteine O-methyltransferase Ste14
MVFRLVVQTGLMLLIMGLVLFLSAGDSSWASAWGFLLEVGILGLAVGLWLAWRNPGLLSERLAVPWQKGQASWDRGFMAAVLLGFCAWLALMAVDAGRLRFSSMPQSLQGVGVLAIAASVWLSWLAFVANRFAATVVKVQPGQEVASDGPYGVVRHPMYAGAIFFFLGAPLLLGSWLGLAAAPIFIAGLGIRAVGEERLLRAELPDYDAYAARVRYRFVPRVW